MNNINNYKNLHFQYNHLNDQIKTDVNTIEKTIFKQINDAIKSEQKREENQSFFKTITNFIFKNNDVTNDNIETLTIIKEDVESHLKQAKKYRAKKIAKIDEAFSSLSNAIAIANQLPSHLLTSELNEGLLKLNEHYEKTSLAYDNFEIAKRKFVNDQKSV